MHDLTRRYQGAHLEAMLCAARRLGAGFLIAIPVYVNLSFCQRSLACWVSPFAAELTIDFIRGRGPTEVRAVAFIAVLTLLVAGAIEIWVRKRSARKHLLLAGASIAVFSSAFVAGGQGKSQCDSSFAKSGEENIRHCSDELRSTNLSDYERAAILNIRGNNYDELKKYDLAIADYTEVIRLRVPGLWDYGYANRALEKCRKGDYKSALPDYDEALRINPRNAWALYGRGVARLRSGNADGGNRDIAEATAIDPQMAATYREIGMTP